jgi:hypothetical protein
MEEASRIVRGSGMKERGKTREMSIEVKVNGGGVRVKWMR